MNEMPPAECTCLWTFFIVDGVPHGNVYIADQECPARPHDRSY